MFVDVLGDLPLEPSLECVCHSASLLRGGKGGKSTKRGPKKTQRVMARTNQDAESRASMAVVISLAGRVVLASMVAGGGGVRDASFLMIAQLIKLAFVYLVDGMNF